MTKRLETLLSLIPQCGIFADIGCDHGYIANAMLLRRKCERVIVSDISAECLKKAETLLSQNFPDKFAAVVSDGFDNVGFADCALIAGMGGDIISEILSSAKNLPEQLVLQPMKNTEKVRRTVIGSGYKILRDYTFRDGKFYDVLVACKGDGGFYTDMEYAFGRDNLKEKGDDFVAMINVAIAELENAESKASDDAKDKLEKRIAHMREALK